MAMEAPLLLPVSTAAGSSSISILNDIVKEAVATSPPPDDESSSSPSTQSIVFRIVAVLVVACASLFAQHEASKGFAINVVSGGAARDSLAGRRFHLSFVSNGRAERILHRASRGVERALFPDASFPRKKVTRVTLTMAGHNLTAADDDATLAVGARGEYVISLSPGLIMSDKAAVAAAVRRAVARMWLWDGRGGAPARVTEAMVEFLASSSSSGSADDELMTTSLPEKKEECMSARFLRHLERRRLGFVARLNRAMRDRWSDAAVDAALGAPARPICAAYLATTPLAVADSTSDATRGSSVAM